jgi:hypothetical protein
VNRAVSGGLEAGGGGGPGEAKIPCGYLSRCGITLGAFGGRLIILLLSTGVGGGAGGTNPRMIRGLLAGRSVGVLMTAGRITRGATVITGTMPGRRR